MGRKQERARARRAASRRPRARRPRRRASGRDDDRMQKPVKILLNTCGPSSAARLRAARQPPVHPNLAARSGASPDHLTRPPHRPQPVHSDSRFRRDPALKQRRAAPTRCSVAPGAVRTRQLLVGLEFISKAATVTQTLSDATRMTRCIASVPPEFGCWRRASTRPRSDRCSVQVGATNAKKQLVDGGAGVTHEAFSPARARAPPRAIGPRLSSRRGRDAA